MKKLLMIVALVLAGALVGCLKSSVPEAKDVSKGLEEFWASCSILRPTDFKKTNGIDRGDFYLMPISYKLEFLDNFAKEDFWGERLPSIDYSSMDYFEAAKKQKEMLKISGEMADRKMDFWINRCPDVLLQKYLNEIISSSSTGESLVGKSIKKGDGLIVEAEFKMIKSENGWISTR